VEAYVGSSRLHCADGYGRYYELCARSSSRA